ncbi:uncharacterized protein LOC103713832 [Phoenix dactylifera]|uniref:Uncharacterized protein LOC103713832 n=1 Tax=Phoenix dactylifera TaxID=42345 RepID=A0A8B7CH38_PHODC|nr:uncharacterized protein LOC103713832 [Phoenix dactylifera]XP_038971786.1 uncharacterized protein LOC103713832 [Phoenix dactylifera]
MAVNRRRDLCRPCSVVAVGFCLLAIWAVGSESRDIRPSEHGLEDQKDPGPTSPAMAAFFQGRPTVALPEARNATDETWRVAPPGPDRSAGRKRARVALLVAGVVCGVVGTALLAAAAVAYVVHARRSRPGGGPGSGFGLGWRRSGLTARLGAA